MSHALADAADRDRIRTDTATTLFVNAGAGSGKTSALVSRVKRLVLHDHIPMRHIAAVTFTEKAGAELRDRLRAELETATSHTDHDTHQRATTALEDLDAAAIGTLHAFAQRLLSENPIEAGLPPLIEVLDEVGSGVAFEERWAALQTELLDDDTIAEPLLLAMTLGLKLQHVRSLALLLGRDWDLIGDRILTQAPITLRVPDLNGLRARAHDAAQLATHCTSDTDKLLPRFHQLAALVDLLDQASDLDAQLEAITQIARLKFSYGQAKNWTRPVDTMKEIAREVAAEAAATITAVLDQCLRLITHWVGTRVLAGAEDRRREGRLEFHDLLVLARDLLRHSPGARDTLHHTYQRLLLDEFQDTDPIQIELAVRIAAGADAHQPHWQDVTVPPGRLFVVGDAKQSIYRFRRASIATYLDAQHHIGTQAGLSTNFRTVKPILDWVNDVFSKLITHQPDAQPPYDPLVSHRLEAGDGPAVTILGADAHTDAPRAGTLREREAADVAAAVRQAIDDQWQVLDQRTGHWRPARPHDIAVLVPARTSLPYLEDALDAAAVPYRAEASSLVYQAAEIRDLLACVRAIADSSDALSLVTALRSPLFGCGDDDLWHYKHAGGRLSVYAHLDGPLADGPVGTALAYLKSLARLARWSTPSEVLSQIVADRRMLEVAALGPRAHDTWRRLRFVVDQARAWSEVSHGGLRAYLAWAAHQGQEASRVAEAVLPETDVDAVRVMTVHAAKGLEFPIVVMSGMTAQPRAGRGVRLLWPPTGGYSVRLSDQVQTGDFETALPIDEQMDSLEQRRLLYVAATRARDHLVVSTHRAEGSKAQTAAALLASAGAATATSAQPLTAPPPHHTPATATTTADPAPDYQQWLTQAERARTASRAPAAITASGLEGTEPEIALAIPDDATAGTAKGPRDLELPPWSKGRYGSAIGRAVHAVLQVVDLTTGAGLEQAVAAQSLTEGVTSHADLIADLTRSALGSDLIQRAAARPHWRETYVGAQQDDGTILEGFVDLIYREDDGTLVIIDYKTDAAPAAALPARVAYYAPQMRAYRTCLAAGTSAPVTTQLLFLHPQAATAIPVD